MCASIHYKIIESNKLRSSDLSGDQYISRIVENNIIGNDNL